MRALLVGTVAIGWAGPALPADVAVQAGLTTVLPQSVLELRGDPGRLLPEGRIPNFSAPLVAGLGGTGAWSIRGIGAASPLAPHDPAIGTFVDGIPLMGRDGSDFALFGLEDVTVRRGGQGAGLGRNTVGGAVQLQLARPGETFAGFVGGGLGSYDSKMVRGSVDLPVGAAAVQVSGYYADDDGVARNTTTGERLNDRDRAGLRLAVRLTPLDALSWTVAAAYTEARGENLLAFDCDPAGGEGCGGRFLTTGLQKARRLGGEPRYSLPVAGGKADFGLGSRVSTTLLSSHLEWGGDALKLAATTGYLDVGERSTLDYADGRGLPSGPVRGFRNGGFAVLTDGADRQVSQDVRLSGTVSGGRLGFVLGGQIIDRRTSTDSADLFTAEDGTADGAPRLVADRIAETRSTALSAFGEATFAVSDRLSLAAGVRYTDESLRFALRDTLCGAGGCLAGAVPARQDFGIWTPSASATVRISEAVNLFAQVSRGYRPGGWNSRASTPGALRSYGAETAWTWQGGVASSWFGGRFDAKVTAFAVNADGYQGSGAAVIDGVPQLWSGSLADFRNRGVELELGAKPVDGLSLYANLGFQDARYVETDSMRAQQASCLAGSAGGVCGVGVIRADGAIARPMRTPDLSAGFGGSFAVAIPSAGIVLTPSADIAYEGRQQTDVANLAPEAAARWLVDAGIAIETDDSFWILSFACRNCLDATVLEQSLLGHGYLAEPRRLQLTARRRF